MIELLASIITVAITIAASGWLLKIEWDQGKCASIVFEQTHAQIAESPPPIDPFGGEVPVQVRSSPYSMEGVGICGESTETVSLPELDPGDSL